MASKPRQALAWPYRVNRSRLSSIERLAVVQKRLDSALEANAHGRAAVVVEADLLHAARHVADVRALLIEAGDGEPDALKKTIEVLHELRYNRSPESERAADVLLSEYQD